MKRSRTEPPLSSSEEQSSSSVSFSSSNIEDDSTSSSDVDTSDQEEIDIADRIHDCLIDGDEDGALGLLPYLSDVDMIVNTNYQEDLTSRKRYPNLVVDDRRLLHIACQHNCPEVVRELLLRGADQTITVEHEEVDCGNALHFAAYYGNDDCAEALAEYSDVAVAADEADAEGLRPLHESLANYHHHVVDTFVEQDLVSNSGLYQLSEYEGEYLPRGTNLALLAAQRDLYSLFVDLFNNHYDLLTEQRTLSKRKQKKIEEDEYVPEDWSEPLGETAIHYLLSRPFDQNHHCQQFLLQRLGQVNINIVDALNRTPIFYLVMNKDEQLLRVVLTQSPKLWHYDYFNMTPFYYAVHSNADRILDALLTYCSTINNNKDKGRIQWALNKQYDGTTLLHIAYRRHLKGNAKSTRIFNMLMRHPGIDFNATDEFGRTLHMVAVENEDTATVARIQENQNFYPNRVVQGTARRKHINDLRERLGSDYMEFAVAVDDICDEEEREGKSFSSDEDEGDAAIHQALKRKKRARSPTMLKTVLKHPQVDDKLRNANGEKALKIAKKGDKEAYEMMRKAQKKYYKTSSTGSSSSEDDQGQSTYKRTILAMLSEQEQDDIEEDVLSKTQKSKKIERDLTTINRCLKEGKSIPRELAQKYCLVHHRGINFLRIHFSNEERRKYANTDQTQFGVYAKITHHNTDIPISVTERTKAQEESLRKTSYKVRRLWRKVFDQNLDELALPWKGWGKNTKKNKNGFTRLSHLAQSRYSNTASIGDGTNRNGQIDIWEDIWENTRDKVTALMDKAQLQQDFLKLDGNMFVSTGKTPQHAVRYAIGKSLAEINRDQRKDARYGRDAKPKYELVGQVHLFLHSMDSYLRTNPSDVLLQHHYQHLSIYSRIKWETEVAFIGGISARHHVASMPIVVPRFDIPYDEAYHLKALGLTREKYTYFKKWFSFAQRPSKHNVEIFGKPYNKRLLNIFGLIEDEFSRYSALWLCLKRHPHKTISLRQLHPYRDLLLREIKIKCSDMKTRDELLEIKKYNRFDWSQPDKKVSVIDVQKYIRKNLRSRSLYRKAKNELREHLIAHYANVLFKKAFTEAKKAGKVLIYRDADGYFKELPESPDDLRKAIVQSSKQTKIDTVEPRFVGFDKQPTAKAPRSSSTLFNQGKNATTRKPTQEIKPREPFNLKAFFTNRSKPNAEEPQRTAKYSPPAPP